MQSHLREDYKWSRVLAMELHPTKEEVGICQMEHFIKFTTIFLEDSHEEGHCTHGELTQLIRFAYKIEHDLNELIT